MEESYCYFVLGRELQLEYQTSDRGRPWVNVDKNRDVFDFVNSVKFKVANRHHISFWERLVARGKPLYPLFFLTSKLYGLWSKKGASIADS